MKETEIKKAFKAGKSLFENEHLQLALVILMVLLDATVIFASLIVTIKQMIILNIILTTGACTVIDGGAELLAILIYKDENIKVKITCYALLLPLMALVFYRLGCFRIETVGGLVFDGLGLIDLGNVPGLDTLGRFMAELPIATTVFIFVSGIVTHDPNKKNNDLFLLKCHSQKRIQALNKAKVLYGSDEERQHDMDTFISAHYKAALSDIGSARTQNDLYYNRKLAEHLHADPTQISATMEEEI